MHVHVCLLYDMIDCSSSSDESADNADHFTRGSSVMRPSTGHSSRPSGQRSRPSSRQGQKYTAAAAAAAAGSAVVSGYHDSVLPGRKVSITWQCHNIELCDSV